MQNQENLKFLLKNLQDLNYLSLKLSNEIEEKNRILRGSIQDSQMCGAYIDNNAKSMNMNSHINNTKNVNSYDNKATNMNLYNDNVKPINRNRIVF
jgi:hypothetical protein